MKFEANTRRRAIEYEKDIVQYWKDNKTFEKSINLRPKDNAYVFYDGPPFITGVPHHGTLLSSIAKDVVPRYWTMRGKRVERVWGWDCHGLPAEVFTEKKLGIQDKRDIGTKISLEEYILTCRENMVQTGSLWEDTIDRIGRWVDFKGAYKTMDKDYMESVWWAFKELYDKGKIYEGEKVLLYCTRDATPISKAEVAMDNSYQDVTDPSVFVKFKLKDYELPGKVSNKPVYLLAWTTTPWTLPANTAVAVNKNVKYYAYEFENENLIVAGALAPKVFTDEKHHPIRFIQEWEVDVKELIGKSYEPLFADRSGEPDGKNAHKVWHADYVGTEEGTGLVHLAPAYGEEDYELSRQQHFPFVSIIDENGFYTEGEWKGEYVWDANKPIAKALHEKGTVFKIEYIRHSYPHCHRCGTKLMYRAHPSWFMDIAGEKRKMLEENENINWFPAHLKHGRFQKTVESAPDWNLSRDRFWATAMPVWKGTDKDGNTRDKDGKEYVKVVGSYEELKKLSGEELADYHRPWVDDIEFDEGGIHYKRIDKVLDCWFESGSMPFAQHHYPFENKEKFESTFPGDFIVEYVGQVRAWFYYVHAVNTALFGKFAYKNVITTGTLAGNDGRKMSKSYGNYTDPNELMDQYSADSLRFLLMSSPVMNAEDYSLQDKDVADVARKLSMVWNMYDFFTLYASVDQWDSPAEDKGQGGAGGGLYDDPLKPGAKNALTNPLDRWIVSRVHQLTEEVGTNLERYDVPSAAKPILPFLDDASNWYVRRSRRRFWKSEDDADKHDAYRTLHYVLVRLAHVMAPFTPFLAEELYRKLTGGESVHLRDWPAAATVDNTELERMAFIREVINDGLSQRAAAGIKVRQPLAEVTVTGAPKVLDIQDDRTRGVYTDILSEELNVKQTFSSFTDAPREVKLNLKVSPALHREGLMREIVRQVQSARKEAGLNVDDRIHLELFSKNEEVMAAIAEHKKTIQAETLAGDLSTAGTDTAAGFTKDVKVESADLAIAIAKQ
jgi:isoleucyl-tRNA synthetase